MKKIMIVIALVCSLPFNTIAQEEGAPNGLPLKEKLEVATTVSKEWFERMDIRGYTQLRYNRLLETNENLKCDQCDKSLGKGGGFFARRARMIFSGELGEAGSFYIQPDFASNSTDQHYLQLRDLYFDINLSKDRAHRLRVGQSKVPFGFENLQSSSRRLATDRNDALNSAVANERDIGVNYYWATPEKRKLLDDLGKNNLKGSGDYGIFGFGLYNGQTANKVERNDSLHAVTRLSYPFEVYQGQIIEPGIQAYRGKFVSNTAATGSANYQEFLDERVALSFMFYPQPFGFQAEYNIGRGPQFNEDLGQVSVEDLSGGYLQMMYNHKYEKSYLVPFVKYQIYEGGKKHEAGAPFYDVNEFEFGVEWQPNPYFEFTPIFSYGDRRIADNSGVSDEHGSRVRLQLQVNY